MAPKKRVVYLLGAGASHGSVKAVGSSRGILMSDLGLPLAEAVRDLINKKRKKFGSLKHLVNEIVYEDADFEHIITFPGSVTVDGASTVRRGAAGCIRKSVEGRADGNPPRPR